MANIAIYPGSFDPITYGHVDIIKRALDIFDKIIIAVTNNPGKTHLFSIEERIHLVKESTKDFKNIIIEPFDTLLVQYARDRKVNVIIRGLRAVSDFEYEYQMAMMNRFMDDTIETIFLMPSERYVFISSRLIKEVTSFGRSVKGLVPEVVEEGLRRKFKFK